MMACWENLNNKSGWVFSSRKATRVTIKDLKLPQDIDNKTLIPEIIQEMHFGLKKKTLIRFVKSFPLLMGDFDDKLFGQTSNFPATVI